MSATRIGSTACRPSAVRVTARTILLTSTASVEPLRLVTRICAGLCGGVSAKSCRLPPVFGAGAVAEKGSASADAARISRGCMEFLRHLSDDLLRRAGTVGSTTGEERRRRRRRAVGRAVS
ncbi:MAG: hypothetical protein NVV68_17750 [Dokdonella sp.]|nr:hypothetical protein [Dokdonella sp.]